eukprot:g62888.t1
MIKLFQNAHILAKRGEIDIDNRSFLKSDKLSQLLSNSMRKIESSVQASISNQSSSQRLFVTEACSDLPACVQPHYQTLQLIWRIAGDPELVRAHNPDLLWADCIIPKNEHYISFACLDCLYEQSNPLPNGVDAEQGTLELEDPSGSCVHVLFLQAFLCTKFVELARVKGESARAERVYKQRLQRERADSARRERVYQRQLRRSYLQLTQTLARLQEVIPALEHAQENARLLERDEDFAPLL